MKYLLFIILLSASLCCSAQTRFSESAMKTEITLLKGADYSDSLTLRNKQFPTINFANTTEKAAFLTREFNYPPDSVYEKRAYIELVKEKKQKRKNSWNISDYDSAVQDYYNAQISIHH